jgi:hypothetical protein
MVTISRAVSYGGEAANTEWARRSNTKYSPVADCTHAPMSAKRPAMCAGRPPEAERVSVGRIAVPGESTLAGAGAPSSTGSRSSSQRVGRITGD